MGGMFTVMKIREGLVANDYKDPGDYRHPQGTVAYEVASSSGPVAPRNGPANQPKAGPKAVRPGNSHKGH